MVKSGGTLLTSALRQSFARYMLFFPEETSRCVRMIQEMVIEVTKPSRRVAHVTASAIVLHRPTSSVLLIKHKILNRWIQPGGHLKSGETTLQAVRREVNEEAHSASVILARWHRRTGIPIDIDAHTVWEAFDSRWGYSRHYDFRYVFYARTRDLRPSADAEVQTAAWFPIKSARCVSKLRSFTRLLNKLQEQKLS